MAEVVQQIIYSFSGFGEQLNVITFTFVRLTMEPSSLKARIRSSNTIIIKKRTNVSRSVFQFLFTKSGLICRFAPYVFLRLMSERMLAKSPDSLLSVPILTESGYP